jgi:hypothetical protein
MDSSREKAEHTSAASPSKMGRWAPEKIKSPMGKNWIHYDEDLFVLKASGIL